MMRYLTVLIMLMQICGTDSVPARRGSDNGPHRMITARLRKRANALLVGEGMRSR